MPPNKTPALVIQLEPTDLAKVILSGLIEVANDEGHQLEAIYEEMPEYDQRGLLRAAAKVADYVAERIREADKVN